MNSTLESKQARKIYEDLLNAQHPFERGYIVQGNAKQVMSRLRVLMGLGMTEKITINVKDNSINIHTKKLGRVTQLENMIRKLALNVDNEKLYDEAMQLLGMEV